MPNDEAKACDACGGTGEAGSTEDFATIKLWGGQIVALSLDSHDCDHTVELSHCILTGWKRGHDGSLVLEFNVRNGGTLSRVASINLTMIPNPLEIVKRTVGG